VDKLFVGVPPAHIADIQRLCNIAVKNTGLPHTVLLNGMLWNRFSVEIMVLDIVPVLIRTPT
jgi:hypothetical protein